MTTASHIQQTKPLPKKPPTLRQNGQKEAKSFGTIFVDDGAYSAMKNGKNLLPAGILKVEGSFDCEAIVDIKNKEEIFAKAIIDYSSDALLKMVGKRTSEIKNNGSSNVIKRENLVLL